MSILFSGGHDEEILALLNDTGVAGATLTVKRFGKHLIFEIKSPHAVMTLLNSNIDDAKSLRRALKRYETTYAEIKNSEGAVRLSRTQVDNKLAERAKREKAKITGKSKVKQKPKT